MPLWGTLTWIFGGNSTELPSNHLIIPGTFFADCCAMGCTLDTHEQRYVERVVLHAGPKRIDLADLYEAIEQFAVFYINWFEATFTESDRHGADVHLTFSLKLVVKESVDHV